MEVLGLDFDSLPEGWTPLEGVLVVKCLMEDGKVALRATTTEGLSTWEAWSMAQAYANTLGNDMGENFISD